MGLRLLTRTKRSVATTEAGERLRQTLAPHVAEIDAEFAQLMEFRDKPVGLVRITLSDHAANTLIWPKLAPVLQQYPYIQVELSLDNGLRNIVEEGFDAGIRLGGSVERDMIAVRAGPDWRLLAVASPAYLERHGVPQHPNELIGHVCINMRQARLGGLYAWEFEKDSHELRVRVKGQLTMNISLLMADAAKRGLGIAYLPDDLTADDVAQGTLQVVLEDWSPHFPGHFIDYPDRLQSRPALRVVVDALRYRQRNGSNMKG